MRKSSSKSSLRILALLFIASAVILLIYSLLTEGNSNPRLPEDATWGGIPVGGLTPAEAIDRVEQAYVVPVELIYQDQTILVLPAELGFSLNAAAMADLAARNTQTGLWARLWNASSEGGSVDLQATVDGEVLRNYLVNEIAARYDIPPQPPLPIPGTTNFTTGSGGRELDVQVSSEKISQALMDPVNRRVKLEIRETPALPAALDQLALFLKHTIERSGFKGIAEIYLQNPASADLLHFAYRNGEDLPPDIAFSAASTIKIPIMVSILRRAGDPVQPEIKNLLERMIEFSENPPADAVMQSVLDPIRAPLEVTADMQESLGLQNTFLAGYFYPGADLLALYSTPANTRTDIDLDPDVYNQTTASDMGKLLTGIYTCAGGQESILTEAFPGEITPEKCQYMLDVLARNKIGVLSEAGVPDGTRVAHKHGWTEELDGYLHTVSDVGIVFSPGADFVFAVYLYDPGQLLFDPANALVAQLVQVIYNYYNPVEQESWRGEPVIFP